MLRQFISYRYFLVVFATVIALTFSFTPAVLAFTQVSADMDHTCGLRSDGHIACWGYNEDGRASAPSGIFNAVSSGGYHSCGLKEGGYIECWGLNQAGQLAVPSEGSFTQVVTGWQHTCGLKNNGEAWCWGLDNYGPNGYNIVNAGAGQAFIKLNTMRRHTCGLKTDGSLLCWGIEGIQTDTPTGVFKEVSTGFDHTCALRHDSTGICWGNNDNGQAPGELTGQFKQLSTGWAYSCGLRLDGSIECWGLTGGMTDLGQATPPSGVFSALEVGYGHACALRSDGQAVCWGLNYAGQATPPVDDSTASTFIKSNSDTSNSCGLKGDGGIQCWGYIGDGSGDEPAGTFIDVASGGFHACGLRDGGAVECWGTNQFGQLDVPTGERFTQIVADWHGTCGLKLNGEALCWGNSANDGTHHLVNAGAGQAFITLDAMRWHTCGLKTDGSIQCWGWYSDTTPTGVFKQVSAGFDHSCAIRHDGTGMCWGANDNGQAPTQLNGEFKQLSAGWNYSCGLRLDGSIECWGLTGGAQDWGQLNAPSGVFNKIDAGYNHACAQRNDGQLVCWGSDFAGQSSLRKTYQLEVVIEGNGYLRTANWNAFFAAGETVNWVIEPDEGYVLAGGSPEECDFSHFVMPNHDLTCTATFVPATELLQPQTFTDHTEATQGTEVVSNSIVISGLTEATAATLSGAGSLLVNGVDVGTSATLQNGDTVAIKTTALYGAGTTKDLTLTYGQTQKNWRLTTAVVDAPSSVAGVVSGYTPVNCDVNESGGAVCSLPITVPAGTGGMAPQLSLNYSSQGSNGSLGVGWSLGGLAAISRCGATLAQDDFVDGVDFDANDRFCLNGERLMAVDGVYGADGTVYYTEQHSFQKVVSYGSAGSGPREFKVWTKAGLVMAFGLTEDARVEAQGRADVLVWALNKVTDSTGNYYVVEYDAFAPDEYLPARIKYTGNENTGLLPYAVVNLVYETRPDTSSRYVSGSLLKSTQRLVGIEAWEGADKLREYHFNYTTGILSQKSKLVSVEECGTDNNCFAPTQFHWAEEQASFDSPTLALTSSDVGGLNVYSWGGVHEYYIDFNNDGFSDRVWRPIALPNDNIDEWWIAFGSPSGLQTPQLLIKQTSLRLVSSYGRHDQFIDVNKDQLPDLVLFPHEGDGLYVSLSDGQSLQPIQLWLQNPASNVNLYSHEGRYETFLDLNMDGYPDKVWIPYGRHDLWVALGTGTSFQTPQMILAADVADGKPPYSYSGWHESYADVNGDGLADRVWIPNPLQDVWVALGDGNGGFETPSAWLKFSDSPVNTWSNQGIYKWCVDLNGDGLADYVWTPDGIADLYVSYSTGTSFKTPEQLLPPNVPNVGPAHSYLGHHDAFVDLNRDGFLDYAWVPSGPRDLFVTLSNHGNGFQISQTQVWMADVMNNVSNRSYDGLRETYTDINGDGLVDRAWIPLNSSDLYIATGIATQTNLMQGITNGHGVATHFDYKPLTDSTVYTKETTAQYPQQDLAAPLYVVSKLSTDNGIGGQRQITYHYEGGKIDLHGRGFRGFSKATQTDTTTGIQQITYYERDYRYISTKVKRSETRLANGDLIAETDNTLGLKDYGNGVHFSRITKSISREYELNNTTPFKTIVTENQYNDYGNPTQIVITHYEGAETSNAQLTETTQNTYQNDLSHWYLGRLVNATVTRSVLGQSAQTRQSAWAYDTNTGLLNHETIEPNTDLCAEKIYTHDAYGNITQSTTQPCSSTTTSYSFAARSQTSTYDVATHRYLIQHSNALNHSETKQYDKFGNLTQLTGPNSLSTTWTYDGFGRPILETRADQTWTATAYHRSDSNSPCPSNAYYYTLTQTAGGNAQYQCFDQLDREIRKASFGFNGEMIFVDTQYNARSEIEQVSEPYFATDTPQWSTFTYDALGRPSQQTAPNQIVTQTVYNGFTTTVISDVNGLHQSVTQTKDVSGNLVTSTDNANNAVRHLYDGFNNLIQICVTLQASSQCDADTLISLEYDVRGNKTALHDPDTGTTTYVHNALGELVQQGDAKQQTTNLTYDKLGRLLTRQTPEGTSTWTYDTATHGIGKLAQIEGADGYQAQHHYDVFGRLVQTATRIDGTTFFTHTHYDPYGRVAALTYPTGFAVRHQYNTYGYLSSVLRADDNQLLWQATAMNARGQLEEQAYGNGVTTHQVFNPQTGFVETIQTGNGSNATAIQDLHYSFDAVGNLTQRQKGSNLTETFNYDNLNRLTRVNLNGNTTQTLGYDAFGNILSKDGVGYSYGANNAGPHAVTQAGNRSYTYDAVGNRITANDGQGFSQSIDYTSFNKPSLITQGSTTLHFNYAPDHARYRQTIERDGQITQILYLGKLYEQETVNGVVKGKHHVFAGSHAIAVYNKDSAGNTSTRYLHRDHLDSVESVTDEVGNVDTVLSFDAWGQRRSENWGELTEAEIETLIANLDMHRGFTGHEHLDEVNLIHMNGRVYDPILGRFLSADPIIQAPGNLQSFNRYSYVLNNPLSFTDPSGFSWWSKTVKKAKNAVKKVGQFFKDNWKSIVSIAVGVILGPLTFGGSILLSGAGFGFGAAFTGSLLSGGNLGDAVKSGLRGAVIGGATAVLSYGVGSAFGIDGIGSVTFGGTAKAAKIVAHGIVGGLSEVANGGKFKHGFLSSAFTEIFSVGNSRTKWGHTVTSAVVGGTVAEIGGGKFANGAVTGAFISLFNHDLHSDSSSDTKSLKQLNRKYNVFFNYLVAGPVELLVDSWLTAERYYHLNKTIYDFCRKPGGKCTSSEIIQRQRDIGLEASHKALGIGFDQIYVPKVSGRKKER